MNKLLVVDDEQDITRFLKEYFEEKGFETFVAQSLEEALSIMEIQRPNCVLLDIKMNLARMVIL